VREYSAENFCLGIITVHNQHLENSSYVDFMHLRVWGFDVYEIRIFSTFLGETLLRDAHLTVKHAKDTRRCGPPLLIRD